MRSARPIRTRIFLGCQGESERSYAKLLHQLVENTHKLHIDAILLNPGAGDPLATVERAISLCRDRENKYGKYKTKAVLLDADQMGLCPERDNQVKPLAARNNMSLIWQKPCHEGFLLRHFPECYSHQPPTANDAMERLRKCWPNYQKGMPASSLAGQINLSTIQAVCSVETDLATFLAALKYFVLPASRG